VRLFACSSIVNLSTTICITGRQWKRVLLSSESDNIPKVVLLIAKTDQARAPHERKADPLVKSKLKSRPSVRQSPLLRPVETCAFSLPVASIYSQQSALPADFVARLIIKPKRQNSKGRAADCE